MKYLLNWVEIPASNIERAKTFYSTILGIAFNEMEMKGARYAIFPAEDQHNCGALVQSDYHQPSPDGVVIYLDGGEDMDSILQQVEHAGGQVIMPKTNTNSAAGHVGMFIDTEGNKIGLQHP